ncbi:NADPH-dependent F420 reductase [Microbacterium lushaniae]|uniref:Oxidoreductase n=1 Tax=Microbacterium lushaniae TaxID=2614639 RepID=A0A5J6L6B0_9MICO|nr:NAD(P)-binding domain-containing protein [Microbacterium lushaniae]QEW04199.1 oxidoreductase [Microbacterium lushaniae]
MIEDIMHITILGTGHMGRTLGAGLLRGGHSVIFGSRAPESATDLPAPVFGHADAIARGEIVLSAIVAARALETLTTLVDEIGDRVLIDIGNAVDQHLELLYPEGSLGERLQHALPRARVVKTLNTLAGTLAVDPSSLPVPTTVFLSGDDAEAKAAVAGILRSLGWAEEQQIDLGGISTARAVEHYFLLFAAMMMGLRSERFNVAVVR